GRSAPPAPCLFPYTPLFRSCPCLSHSGRGGGELGLGDVVADLGGGGGHDVEVAGVRREEVTGALDLDEDRDTRHPAGDLRRGRGDRKSTRLNSSHVSISYAV